MAGRVQTVRDRIVLFTDADSEPALTGEDIDAIMRLGRRMDSYGNIPNDYPEWEANFSYAVGDTVVSVSVAGDQYVPVRRNGFFYTATVAGMSGNTEPVWPLAAGTVTDGAVTWAYTGTAPWMPTYDVNYSIAQGWLLKSTRLVGHYNFMSGGRMFSREQFYNHCMDLYKRFSTKAGLKGVPLNRQDSAFGYVETSADG